MRAASTGRTHGCSDQAGDVRKVLANTEPSTHGTLSPDVYRGLHGESWVKKLTSFQVCVGRAQDAGWRVLEADSADQALAMLRAGQQIDIVITDVQLKGAPTGWDVAEAFRAAQPTMPVIYASAQAILRSCQGFTWTAGVVIEGVCMTRILIADDHAVVRSGVRCILADHPGWNVVAEAATANTPFGSLPCSRRQ